MGALVHGSGCLSQCRFPYDANRQTATVVLPRAVHQRHVEDATNGMGCSRELFGGRSHPRRPGTLIALGSKYRNRVDATRRDGRSRRDRSRLPRHESRGTGAPGLCISKVGTTVRCRTRVTSVLRVAHLPCARLLHRVSRHGRQQRKMGSAPRTSPSGSPPVGVQASPETVASDTIR